MPFDAANLNYHSSLALRIKSVHIQRQNPLSRCAVQLKCARIKVWQLGDRDQASI